MDKQVKTFGEALKEQMQGRGSTPEAVCKAMGIKSQTTLNRILHDKSSSKKLSAFFEELCAYNPLQLSKQELEALRATLIVNRMGYTNYKVKQQFLAFVQPRPPAEPCVLRQAYGTPTQGIESMEQLFASYLGDGSVRIFLSNCIYQTVIEPLAHFLVQAEGQDLSVEHYINSAQNPVKGTENFIQLLGLLGSPHYQCYFASNIQLERNIHSGGFTNCMLVTKWDEQGRALSDILYCNSAKQFTLLANCVDQNLCAFYLQLYTSFRQQCSPLKSIHHSDDPDIDGFTTLSVERSLLEQKYDIVKIKADFSMQFLSPSLVQSILEHSIFAFPEDKIVDYMQIHSKRWHSFCQRDKTYTLICTEKGMQHFFETGKLIGWGSDLPPLCVEQLRGLLEDVFALCAQNANIQLRLLQTELQYPQHVYALYGTEALLLSAGKLDCGQQYYSCTIKTDYILEGFSRFLQTDLLPQYVRSHEESLAFLQRIHASL